MNRYSNARTRISRSKRRPAWWEAQQGATFTPRRVWAPRPETIAKLEADISALPATTLYIPTDLARTMIVAVKRLNGRQRWLSHRVTSMNQQLRDLRHRMRLTTRLACSQDLHTIHDWLVNPTDCEGRNANTGALAKHCPPLRRLPNP